MPARRSSPGLCRTQSVWSGAYHAARPTRLFVFEHGDWPSVADSAVRPRLWCVQRVSAPAAPHHVAAVARTPDRIHRPAPVAAGMAGRTARRGRPPNRAQSRSNRRRRCSGNASRRGSAAATLPASLLIAAEGPWLSWWASPGFGPLPENRDAKDSEMPCARDPQ